MAKYLHLGADVLNRDAVQAVLKDEFAGGIHQGIAPSGLLPLAQARFDTHREILARTAILHGMQNK